MRVLSKEWEFSFGCMTAPAPFARPTPKGSAVLGLFALFVAYTAWRVRGGLLEGFTHDDLMNLYKGVFAPWPRLLLDCLCIWRPSDAVRPLAEVTYKLLWSAFHFHPLPYRLLCLTLVALNTGLCYLAARRLSLPVPFAIVAAAAVSFHGAFWGIYSNTGMIFDIQIITTFLLVVLTVTWSPTRPALRILRTALVLLLTLAAVNTKEVAVSIPVAIGVIVLLRRSLRSDWVLLLGSTVLTAVFVFGRVLGHGGLESVPAYQLHLTLDQFRANFAHFLAELTYNAIPSAPVALLAIPALAFAALRWWRELLFWLLVPISFLPVAFIPQRGLDTAEISVFWLLVTLGSVLTRLLPKPAAQWAVAAAASAALLVSHATLVHMELPIFHEESSNIATTYRQIERVFADLPHDASVAFARDAYSETFPWATTFMALLSTERSDFRLIRAIDLASAEQGTRLDLVLALTPDYRLLRCGSGLTPADLAAGRYSCTPAD